MAIFRLQENVPEVYVRQSRDFQLLCNSFDVVQNAVKYDIDSMLNCADTQLCPHSILPLLQNKLGFFTDKYITNSELRTVLQAFRYVVRDKGSRQGIQEAIEVFLKLANASTKSQIRIDTDFSDGEYHSKVLRGNTYLVEVAIEGEYVDTTLLTELLKYVIPAGFCVKYSFYRANDYTIPVTYTDDIQIIFVNTYDHNGIRINDATNSLTFEVKRLIDEESAINGKPSSETQYTNTAKYFVKHNTEFILVEDAQSFNWPNNQYYQCEQVFSMKKISDINSIDMNKSIYVVNNDTYELVSNTEELSDLKEYYQCDETREYTKVSATMFNSISAVSTATAVPSNTDIKGGSDTVTYNKILDIGRKDLSGK